MDKNFSISFVLPMFNERDNIKNAIEEIGVISLDLTEDYEIVVVDDASTDDSIQIVERIMEENKTVRLFKLEENTKFGGAFARGFKEAQKDIILYMDSDMPIEKEDIKASFPLISEYDIVSGYSKVKKGDTFKRKIISGTYNLIVEILFGLKIKDINSGYKIVRKNVVEGVDFTSRSPFVDVELFLHAKQKNSKISQYPLVFKSRKGGKSYISSIPIILATFRDMIKVRFKLFNKTK